LFLTHADNASRTRTWPLSVLSREFPFVLPWKRRSASDSARDNHHGLAVFLLEGRPCDERRPVFELLQHHDEHPRVRNRPLTVAGVTEPVEQVPRCALLGSFVMNAD
jgi:hypothetical protein